MTGCTNKLFSNCVDVCINWGFEIPTELLLYLRKCFFKISINKTIICEKLKKKKKGMLIYGGESLKRFAYPMGYYSSHRQSDKVLC